MSNDLFYFYILFWTRQVHERRALQGQQPEGLVWLLGLCRVNGQASGNITTESRRRCMNERDRWRQPREDFYFLTKADIYVGGATLCPPHGLLEGASDPLWIFTEIVLPLLVFVLGQKKKNYLTQDLKRKVKIEKNILIFYFLKNDFYWLWKKVKKYWFKFHSFCKSQ